MVSGMVVKGTVVSGAEVREMVVEGMTDRQRDRQRHTHRERERQTDTETESLSFRHCDLDIKHKPRTGDRYKVGVTKVRNKQREKFPRLCPAWSAHDSNNVFCFFSFFFTLVT